MIRKAARAFVRLAAAPLLLLSASGALAGSVSNAFALQPVKEIGVRWRGDKPSWMGFVSFSRDGTMVASDGPSSPGDVSGDLTIWSFPKGRLLRHLAGRPWSMSGDWKYYAAENGIRDVETGRPVLLLLPKDVFGTTAFSPDGNALAESSSGIRLIDLQTGKRTASFGQHTAFSLAISPDGKTLASGYWDLVTLWRMRSGTRIGALRGFAGYVDGIAFSRNGRLLAAGTDRGVLQIWDVRRRRKLHSLDLEGSDVSVPAFSPDGRLVAVGVYGTGTVWLVDVRTGRILDHQLVSGLGCGAVAFSPDGRFLITPSPGGLVKWPPDFGGTIRVFRVVPRRAKPD